MRGRTLLIAGLLTAAFAGQAAAQIIGTQHNLSAQAGDDNDEICVYCHTPHAADTTVAAPLWNKPSTGTIYTSYDSTTIDGTILAVGSVSIACLTCHDGTQAMDAVINAPGSGLGTADIDGLIKIGNGLAMSAGVAVLGADLSNDHPIGIQYGGFEVAGVQIDPDFMATGDLSATAGLNTATINNGPVWWVNTSAGGNTGRDKEDMILYTRGGEPYVECATCHDPHENTATDTQVNFLRLSNNSSDLCLACHIK